MYDSYRNIGHYIARNIDEDNLWDYCQNLTSLQKYIFIYYILSKIKLSDEVEAAFHKYNQDLIPNDKTESLEEFYNLVQSSNDELIEKYKTSYDNLYSPDKYDYFRDVFFLEAIMATISKDDSAYSLVKELTSGYYSKYYANVIADTRILFAYQIISDERSRESFDRIQILFQDLEKFTDKNVLDTIKKYRDIRFDGVLRSEKNRKNVYSRNLAPNQDILNNKPSPDIQSLKSEISKVFDDLEVNSKPNNQTSNSTGGKSLKNLLNNQFEDLTIDDLERTIDHAIKDTKKERLMFDDNETKKNVNLEQKEPEISNQQPVIEKSDEEMKNKLETENKNIIPESPAIENIKLPITNSEIEDSKNGDDKDVSPTKSILKTTSFMAPKPPLEGSSQNSSPKAKSVSFKKENVGPKEIDKTMADPTALAEILGSKFPINPINPIRFSGKRPTLAPIGDLSCKTSLSNEGKKPEDKINHLSQSSSSTVNSSFSKIADEEKKNPAIIEEKSSNAETKKPKKDGVKKKKKGVLSKSEEPQSNEDNQGFFGIIPSLVSSSSTLSTSSSSNDRSSSTKTPKTTISMPKINSNSGGSRSGIVISNR